MRPARRDSRHAGKSRWDRYLINTIVTPANHFPVILYGKRKTTIGCPRSNPDYAGKPRRHC